MMGFGAVASLYFLVKYKPFVLDWSAAPLILIYCLPIWVLVHYCFFAQEPDLQWLEMKSLWVRVIAGMLIATAMGVLIRKSDRINIVFIFAFFGMSISVISVYFFNSWKLGYFISTIDFLWNFLFDRNKVGVAFFSVVSVAVGCSFLSYFISIDHYFKFRILLIGILILLMTISLLSSVIASTKNGVAIGLMLIAIFVAISLVFTFKNKNFKSKASNIVLLLSVVIFLIVGLVHKNTATVGWDTLFSDIKVAAQIDRYQAWRGYLSSRESMPVNESGSIVAGNTYERVAWIFAGSREVIRHPMGYGLINHPSFPRWLKGGGISFDYLGSTHSGWIDLALAYGIPGLLIIINSIVLTLILSLSAKKYFFNYLAFWISLAVIMAGIVQEIVYKHTFEAAIFFVALSGSIVCRINNKFSFYILRPKCKTTENKLNLKLKAQDEIHDKS
jgi:hypothetical protein